MLLTLCALFSVLSENFLRLETFKTLSNDIPTLMVMAVGITFVLITDGIDLSVGSILALAASVLSTAMVQWGWGLFPVCVLGVLSATV